MQPFFHNTSISQLVRNDFHVFYLSYREVVKEKVPNFEKLFFFHSADSALDTFESFTVKKAIHDFFSLPQQDQGLYRCCDDCILLTIPTQDSPTLAVLSGLDGYFAKKVAEDWLLNFGESILDRFLLIKRAGTDLETGLLNCQCFYATLQQMTGNFPPSVLLLEVNSHARSAKEAKVHTAKVVNSLNNCINGKLNLYSLGHDVFALLTNALEEEVFSKLGKSLMSSLRRDGFSRVHIGLRSASKKNNISSSPSVLGTLVDDAWFALQAARKRGPFSLCDFELFSHPEKHLLRRPSKSLLAKFRRKWLKSDTFSIVQVQPGNSGEFETIKSFLQDENIISEKEDIYIYMNGIDPGQAMQWASQLQSDLQLDDTKIGIGYYPHSKFTKSATVMNCRKALHHAAFFGKNGAAVFDAVSLNVSGDIYYAEGDLTSAVKEYKNGLLCDPKNINLLNSLGVTYADMSKHREAHKCFKKVLTLVPNNFMALYNLGLGEELIGKSEEALKYFERSSQASSETLDDLKDDLQFHLGKLYCKTGRYQNAVKILQNLYNDKSKKNKDRVLPYLGNALYGTGRLEEAMTYLQRALSFDEFDASSMGLLGLIYLLQQEGQDIALSLCRNSVDLDPDCIELRLFLARVEIACGHYQEAKENLKKCLRKMTTQVEAQLYLCICYQQEGLKSRARYWHRRLLKNKRLDPGISAQAHKIGEEIDAK